MSQAAHIALSLFSRMLQIEHKMILLFIYYMQVGVVATDARWKGRGGRGWLAGVARLGQRARDVAVPGRGRAGLMHRGEVGGHRWHCDKAGERGRGQVQPQVGAGMS
jgi:hypothetical protein